MLALLPSEVARFGAAGGGVTGRARGAAARTALVPVIALAFRAVLEGVMARPPCLPGLFALPLGWLRSAPWATITPEVAARRAIAIVAPWATVAAKITTRRAVVVTAPWRAIIIVATRRSVVVLATRATVVVVAARRAIIVVATRWAIIVAPPGATVAAEVTTRRTVVVTAPWRPIVVVATWGAIIVVAARWPVVIAAARRTIIVVAARRAVAKITARRAIAKIAPWRAPCAGASLAKGGSVALLALIRLVDMKCSPVHHRPIEREQRALDGLVVGHLDEAKPFALT